MVKETRIIFNPEDVKSIRIRCNVKRKDSDGICNGETLYLPGGGNPRPIQCAVCGQDWWVSDANYRDMLSLLDAITILQNSPSAKPATVIFEIDGDESR